MVRSKGLDEVDEESQPAVTRDMTARLNKCQQELAHALDDRHAVATVTFGGGEEGRDEGVDDLLDGASTGGVVALKNAGADESEDRHDTLKDLVWGCRRDLCDEQHRLLRQVWAWASCTDVSRSDWVMDNAGTMRRTFHVVQDRAELQACRVEVDMGL